MLAFRHPQASLISTSSFMERIMTYRLALALAIITPISGCTIFSPYIPSAKIERELNECKPSISSSSTQSVKDGNKTTTTTTRKTSICNSSAKRLSQRLREEYQASAASLSRTTNTASLTMAGLLGLGAYKGITDGGKHQIAALAAGAGTLYGLQSALYKPTREQLYQRAVKALVCLDDIYADIDPNKGADLAEKYMSDESWGVYEDRYLSAYEIAVTHENSYRSRIHDISADLNILLADDQPTPEENLAKINSAISGQVAGIATGGEGGNQKFLPLNNTVYSTPYKDLERWVVRTIFANNRITAKNPDSCNMKNLPVIRVLGVENQGLLELTTGETRTLPITNNSNVIAINTYPNDSADKDAISTLLISEQGAFAARIEAKVATNKPVLVKITDAGNGNISTVFQIKVNDAESAPEEEHQKPEDTETDDDEEQVDSDS